MMFLKSVRINNLVFVRLGIKLWSGVEGGGAVGCGVHTRVRRLFLFSHALAVTRFLSCCHLILVTMTSNADSFSVWIFFLSNLLLFWFEGLVGCGGVRLLLTEVSPS